MKLTFYCDSGANIHSSRTETFDLDSKTRNGFWMSKEEWLALSEDEKQEQVNEWANERIDIGFTEE